MDNAVEVGGLYKSFGNVNAVNGVSFVVPQGTVLGLLGPNGAGKTTTVRMLTTIIEPDSGWARILGLDVASNGQKVRESIGLAGQSAAVDGVLTGSENLRMIGRLNHMPLKEVKERASELIQIFDLTGFADRPVKTYSGGQRRRLDLAASLVHRPEVLFLDEPTTGLDIQSRQALWQVIEDLVSDGVTIVLTTQYLEEADELADNIVLIDNGVVVAEGTPEELKSRHGKESLDDVFLALTGDQNER